MTLKSIFQSIFKSNKHAKDISKLTSIMYDENVPLIVFDKAQLKDEPITKHSSHYCREEFVNPLIAYCKELGIEYIKFDSFVKETKKYTNKYTYITLRVDGHTLSGQSFHRVLNSAKKFAGIKEEVAEKKRKYSLKKKHAINLHISNNNHTFV